MIAETPQNSSKYSAAHRIFNSLLSVSSGDVTLHLMLDILLKVLWHVTYGFHIFLQYINIILQLMVYTLIGHRKWWHVQNSSGTTSHGWVVSRQSFEPFDIYVVTKSTDHGKLLPRCFSIITSTVFDIHFCWSFPENCTHEHGSQPISTREISQLLQKMFSKYLKVSAWKVNNNTFLSLFSYLQFLRTYFTWQHFSMEASHSSLAFSVFSYRSRYSLSKKLIKRHNSVIYQKMHQGCHQGGRNLYIYQAVRNVSPASLVETWCVAWKLKTWEKC